MKLRCIVVDDEALARKLIEENIRSLPFLEWVKSCKNPYEAMEVLQQASIDLMFLDVQMPGMLGTHFLKSLRRRPMVIFVTAYANYAVESYELDVVDYLLKPVSLERFAQAAYKALDLWKLRHEGASLPGLTPHSKPVPAPSQDHFFVNVEYSLVKVVIPQITHVESMKDYVKIFLETQAKPIITKATLKSMEEKLHAWGFMRIHKSFLVNLDKVHSIRNHQLQVGSHDIPVSESHMAALLEQLGYER